VRRALPWAVAVVGLALAVAGVAVFWRTNVVPSVTYGGGYAPLEPVDAAHESTLVLGFDDVVVLWTRGHLVGAGLLVLGALVLAAVGGWALGRRSVRPAAG
jgi:hypothetical protein